MLFGTVGFLAGAGLGIFIAIMIRDLPPVALLTQYQPATQTIVLDQDGNSVGRYYDERRQVLKTDDIPQHVIQALLAAEDRKFYSHGGFDYLRILGAAWGNIKSRGISQGASTITQQVARMIFLTTERTFTRKIKEALVTLQIERQFSKDEIITIYLNQSGFGHGSYGIEAAARTYYNKSVQELTTSESALLVSLLKNPSKFSPINYPERSLKSRNRVIGRMHRCGFITNEEYKTFTGEPLNLNRDIQQGFIAPYFVEEIRRLLESEFGSESLKRDGLTVISTLNRRHQEIANQAIQNGLDAFAQRNPDSSDRIQAAIVSIRPGTGEITAMVGGSSFRKTQFNRAVQAQRQPGSAIKPVLYLDALLNGYNPSTVIMDTPYTYEDPITGRKWTPTNYDNRFRGPVTLRQSLENSLNIPTAKLLEKTGIESFLHTARLLGIESELPPYPSVVLGAGEVTLLELTNAYATIAAGGIKAQPRMIQEVKDTDGRVIYEQPLRVQDVLDPNICFQLTHILTGAVENGTGWRAKALNRPIAGKTGTTNDYTNAWFIGYVPDLVVGVWVGFDIASKMGQAETGSRTAGPIFTEFMIGALADEKITEFEVPKGITQRQICYDTGYLATSGCRNTLNESFIGDNFPKYYCSVHTQ
jgi:penicillin-binding protein 1A